VSARLTHPFERWPRRRRRLALVSVVIAALVPAVALAVVTPLHEDRTGQGIVEFELAGSVERAEAILDVWRARGVVDAAQAIQVFDLLYPLIYVAAIAGGCVAAAGAWRGAGRARMAGLGIGMAWVAFAAAGFDYVENVGLAVSLWGRPASPWPEIALVAAVLKFSASGLALLYALTGPIGALGARRGAGGARTAGS
jgi:hypothetical protein